MIETANGESGFCTNSWFYTRMVELSPSLLFCRSSHQPANKQHGFLLHCTRAARVLAVLRTGEWSPRPVWPEVRVSGRVGGAMDLLCSADARPTFIQILSKADSIAGPTWENSHIFPHRLTCDRQIVDCGGLIVLVEFDETTKMR